MSEAHFIHTALYGPEYSWQGSSLRDLAALLVPDGILGRNNALLRADVNNLWARWFVEGIVDPRIYLEKEISYAFIFSDVFKVICKRFPSSTKEELRELSSIVAKITQRLIFVFQEDRKRISASKNDRVLLLEVFGKTPRCWICGGEFPEESIDNFIYQKQRKLPQPFLIDVFKPRGLKQWDLSIEIDHVVPHALGGRADDNLRLSCGWCNRHKSSFDSIYDVDGYPKRASHNQLGISTLPRPFWSVRILATKRCCEHYEGCDASSDCNKMTISPICFSGAANPCNLKVTCYTHDPFKSNRLQSPEFVKKIWNY